MLRELLPDATHLYTEVCERAGASSAAGEAFAAYVNERRFFLTDAFLGRLPADQSEFTRDVVAAGGETLLNLDPGIPMCWA